MKELTKGQKILIFSSLLMVGLLYFGFDYKPKNIKSLEKSRENNLEVTSIENLLLEARNTMSLADQNLMEAMKPKSKDDLESLKAYSSKWYELGFPVISAYYAEEVAKRDSTAESWSIAGTSYGLGAKSSEKEKEKLFANKRAIACFENAISLQPEEISNQINLALMYVDMPPKDQPMKGILMLRQLNEKNPKNVSVLNQLARLAIATNQLDKAEGRLKEAIAIEPNNKMTNCMLADLLSSSKPSEANLYKSVCERLSK